jgi:hypothetical protein
VGPLGIQLPRRLTEKVSQESITSEPNNSSEDNHGGADYHSNGNKGREECHDTGSLNGKPRWPAHGHRGFLVQRNHESGGIVIVYRLPERCDSGNSVISTFCNRDIFAVQRISPRRNVPRNENGNLLSKMGKRFRPQRVSPDRGMPGLSH